MLAPPPPDPRSLLREVQRALESWSGPLPDAQAFGEGLRSGIDLAQTLARPLPPLTRAELLPFARKLRWLRGCELRGWAEAFGRLRWIVHRTRLAGLPDLDAALDEGFRPRQSWARECGHDPEARLRKQRRNELYRHLDALPRGDPAALLRWLGSAFELGQELHNGKLAQVLAERAGEIAALPQDAYEDRAKRKRLRKLQELLANGGVAAATDEEPDAEEPRAEPATPAEAEDVPERVLEFTRGKRTLIVGNRADPALDEALLEAFEFERLDRCDLSPNRVESHADRIRAGSYDLVLAITGFMSHKTDHALLKACRAADVLFVRVNKGRPSACARHIARELGFQSETAPLLP